MNYNDQLITLINNLTNNAQYDDTDINNVLIQLFQSPFENFSIGEVATITKWDNSLNYLWGGPGVTANWNWNQGGKYMQSMEVLTCLALI